MPKARVLPSPWPLWNRLPSAELGSGADQVWDKMTFGYSRPFSITIAPQPAINVVSVRHGVTEITLSDGRLVRATLHVKEVKINTQKPGDLDVSYSIAAEVMPTPSAPILDVHETIQ